MKLFGAFAIGILVLLNGLSMAYGNSGGWVGNAPLASYSPQIAFQNYYTSEPEEEWNSILLPEGQSRLGIGFSYCDTCYFSKTYMTIGYKYGITSKLTLLDLLTFGYSLKSGSGKGSEWALVFGGMDGIIDRTSFGTSVGFGVGIAYAYSESDWRFDFLTTLSSYYNMNHSYWRKPKLSATASVTTWLSENWGVGLSMSYLFRPEFSKTVSCGSGCYSSDWLSEYNDFTDPKIYALLRLNKAHEIELAYKPSLARDRSIVSIGYSYMW